MKTEQKLFFGSFFLLILLGLQAAVFVFLGTIRSVSTAGFHVGTAGEITGAFLGVVLVLSLAVTHYQKRGRISWIVAIVAGFFLAARVGLMTLAVRSGRLPEDDWRMLRFVLMDVVPLIVVIYSCVHLTLILKGREVAEPGATDNPDDAQRFREDH